MKEAKTQRENIIGTVDEWRHMLDVNVIALNLCTQLAVKSMIKVTDHIYNHLLSKLIWTKKSFRLSR